MQLNAAEISELIRKRIEKFEAVTEARTEGTVVSVTDGILRIHGLADVMQGEMLEFPGNTFGMALNLERDSVGAVVLGSYEHITEGDTVKCTGRILEVPVGEGLLGRVVDSLGNPIDGRGPIQSSTTSPIEKVVEAQVVSAFPMSKDQEKALTAALKKRMGREVKLTCSTDESLIGGAVVRAGDLVIDGSVTGQLHRLTGALAQ